MKNRWYIRGLVFVALSWPGLFGVFPVGHTATAASKSLATAGGVKSVNYEALFVPNDPLWALQWNMTRMNIPAAWDADPKVPAHGGDPRVVVAVLDSGLALTAVGAVASVPDFISSHLWTNTSEVPGDGIDNDHNGYIDDIHGWNFIQNSPTPADDNGHGTHIANTIAAGTDNAIATAGVAGNVTIMPLKVLDSLGKGTTAPLTAAVEYAIQQHVQVINLSLGGDEDDPTLHHALQDAVAQGIIVVGAAGNKGTSPVTFPAAYSEVISVGAINTDDSRANYSNFGSALDLVAPGGNTSVDLNHDGQPDGVPAQMCLDGTCSSFDTIYVAGTSQAAAEVSGVAALLLSCGAQPGNVQTLMQSTASDLGPAGRDDSFGHGLVDAAAALHAAGCTAVVPAAPTEMTVSSSRLHSVPLVPGVSYPYQQPRFVWNGPVGATYSITWKKGSRVIERIRQTSHSYSPLVTTPAGYQLSVTTIDGLGQSSASTDIVYTYQPSSIILSSGTTVQTMNSTLGVVRSWRSPFGKIGLRISGGNFGPQGKRRILVNEQPRGSGLSITDEQGKLLSSISPFGPKFPGTSTATGLIAADGTQLLVAGTATSGGTIAWMTIGGRIIGQNLVFPKYTGGVTLAAGDVNGDGDEELVVAQAAGPAITVYNRSRQRLATFTPRGAKYTQGWNVALGDINGDGQAEIIAVPRLSGASSTAEVLNAQGKKLSTINLAGSSVPLEVTAVDVDGDGRDEIATVPQRGSGVLRVINGSGKLVRQLKLTNTNYRSLSSL